MTAIDRLIESTESRRLKICVAGDSLLDEWVYGHYGDCQDGCKKFHVKEVVVVPGGAANAANSLKNWNVEAKLFSMAGTLPRKRRYMMNSQIVFREDSEVANYGLTAYKAEGERRYLLIGLRDFQPDAILLSDYDKGTLNQWLVTEITLYAQNRRIPIVSDAKREPLFYSGTVLKCNAPYAYRHRPQRVVESLAGLVITHGDKPPDLGPMKDGDWPAMLKVWCVNHVGAGDCFAAHLTLGLAHELSLEQAALVANSAGRCYVKFEHNRAPTPEEIQADVALGVGAEHGAPG